MFNSELPSKFLNNALKELWSAILIYGNQRGDRTGTGTLSLWGGHPMAPSMRWDLRDYFPLETLKETKYKVSFLEMLWFLRGEDNVNYLHEHGSKLWDPWAKDGKVGPIYGVQWRKWRGEVKSVCSFIRCNGDQIEKDVGDGVIEYDLIDQINDLIEGIRKNPEGRRHIVTAWNPADVPTMGLPPCHMQFQCYVEGEYLDLQMYIRSWDTVLGGSFNIAQYALLTHLLARATFLKPRWLSIVYGDAHIYNNQLQAMKEIVLPREVKACAPQLIIRTDNIHIDGYRPEDFLIEGYDYHPHVKFDVAV